MFQVPSQQNSGIPLIGLGTWDLRGKECEKAVQQAIEIGYRHIDTADMYENHKVVGRAIKALPREDIFLTSKILPEDLSPKKIEKAVPRYLEELQTDYIDLLLIHWPMPNVDFAKILQAMMAFKEKGLVRMIGVSNFVRANLRDLAPYKFPIVTNQIELHPYFQRRELVSFCKGLGISITAYRPLGKGIMEKDPVLKKIGAKHGKSASQVVLRWLIEQDIVAIPKASSLEHLKNNINIFDFALTDSDKKEIASLDQGKRLCNPEGLPVLED